MLVVAATISNELKARRVALSNARNGRFLASARTSGLGRQEPFAVLACMAVVAALRIYVSLDT